MTGVRSKISLSSSSGMFNGVPIVLGRSINLSTYLSTSSSWSTDKYSSEDYDSNKCKTLLSFLLNGVSRVNEGWSGSTKSFLFATFMALKMYHVRKLPNLKDCSLLIAYVSGSRFSTYSVVVSLASSTFLTSIKLSTISITMKSTSLSSIFLKQTWRMRWPTRLRPRRCCPNLFWMAMDVRTDLRTPCVERPVGKYLRYFLKTHQ